MKISGVKAQIVHEKVEKQNCKTMSSYNSDLISFSKREVPKVEIIKKISNTVPKTVNQILVEIFNIKTSEEAIDFLNNFPSFKSFGKLKPYELNALSNAHLELERKVKC